MILHITTYSAWQKAKTKGYYEADSLQTEGFIHCSMPHQVLGPANALFAGQPDLVLLCLDIDKVQADIVYEDCYESGQAFPHVYGRLNLDAILQVIPFPPNKDGTFSLPVSLQTPPILEFDPTETAIIEPKRLLSPIDIAPHAVLCFFQDVLTSLDKAGRLNPIYKLGSEIGPNWVYELEFEGKRVAVIHPGVGAPLAAAFLDELIALGCRQFIACGGCGVLEADIDVGQIIIPQTAVRDEGTSYHYLPPSREVAGSPTAVAAIKAVLTRRQIPYLIGKTWTTDAVYRETRPKTQLRRAEGCLTVEMETAAFFAVAQFRGVTFGQLLYGGDDLSGNEWDSRRWLHQTSTREKLFWLAVEACLEL